MATQTQPPKTIKSLTLTSTIPSSYIFPPSQSSTSTTSAFQIPTVDFSGLLASADPNLRSETVSKLGRACREWGFFAVTNHGVPEELTTAMIAAAREFFEMAEEDKDEYRDGKGVLEPIRCGTSFNSAAEKVHCWKDFLKAFVHPVFHSPSKPPGFSKVLEEYSTKTRQVAKELLRGISESLGLEADYISRMLDLEQGMFQLVAANFYPPCPQPELALGMAPHSDHGLLTLLIHNGVDGLQVHHRGHWVNVVNVVSGSFLVNTGDHLEILSNGKYKSVLHRATVNKEATRISVAMAHAPSMDSVVGPAPKLLEMERAPAAFKGLKYGDYLLLKQSKQLDGKFSLDFVRV